VPSTSILSRRFEQVDCRLGTIRFRRRLDLSLSLSEALSALPQTQQHKPLHCRRLDRLSGPFRNTLANAFTNTSTNTMSPSNTYTRPRATLTKTPTASPPRRPPTSSAFHWYPYHFCVERTQLLSRAILGKGSTRTTPLPLSIFRAGHPRSSSVRIEGSRDRRSPVVDQNSKPPPGCQVQPRR
jgi:hypothetical protein